MFAVNGIYDGETIRITTKIPDKKKYRVVITFLEELSDNNEFLRDFSSDSDGFGFWDNPAEDLYQDFLTISK
jgi:hypothetical protein